MIREYKNDLGTVFIIFLCFVLGVATGIFLWERYTALVPALPPTIPQMIEPEPPAALSVHWFDPWYLIQVSPPCLVAGARALQPYGRIQYHDAGAFFFMPYVDTDMETIMGYLEVTVGACVQRERDR